jgi:hypothetical protein
LKRPGKGVDPQKWSAKSHDREQWEKIKALPNVLYSEGYDWAVERLYAGPEGLGRICHLWCRHRWLRRGIRGLPE